MNETQERATEIYEQTCRRFQDVVGYKDAPRSEVLLGLQTFLLWLYGRESLDRARQEYEGVTENPKMAEQHFFTMIHYCKNTWTLVEQLEQTMLASVEDDRVAASSNRLN